MNSGISPLLLASGGIGNTITAPSNAIGTAQQAGFLGGIFHRRERKLSKSDESGSSVSSVTTTTINNERSTEV